MKIIYILIFIFTFSFLVYSQEAQFYKIAVDVESNISGGVLSLEEIVRTADQLNIDALILGDEFYNKFEYGIGPGPFKYLFKKTVISDSVCEYGLKSYLDLIEELNAKYPQVLLIEGFEVSPYYWWRGSFFKRNLQLIDWHRQFIVTGLTYDDYNNLPITSKGNSKYSQYSGDLWFEPYQDFIDFIDSRGGLTFWAHPDESYNENINGINAFTQHYPQILSKTNNYTGFCILFGGYSDTGKFSGIWDDLLMSYCRGERTHPVWAIGELDYTEASEIKRMDDLLNFVRALGKKREEIFAALKNGRMHVSWNLHRQGIYLSDFHLTDNSSQKKAFSADTLDILGDVSLVVRLKVENDLDPSLVINVLKNGELFDIKEVSTAPGKVVEVIIDDKVSDNKKGYYRIEINYQGGKIISNPIFFRKI